MIAPLRSWPSSAPCPAQTGKAPAGDGLPESLKYAMARWAFWGVSAPSPEAMRKFHFWRRRVQALSWRLAVNMLPAYSKEPRP